MAASTDRPFGTVAVAASFLAIGLAVIYWLARTGFVNPVADPANAAMLSLFMINMPYVARLLTRRVTSRYTWATSYSFYWLVAIAVAIAAGWITATLGIGLFPAIAAAGVVAFLVTLADWLRGGLLWRSAVIVGGSLAFSTFAGGVVWGRIYKSPLFTEMLQVNGVVHHDPVGLAAIANMLATYGVATPGLDGLRYMPYHWGSPWIFAQLAALLDSGVLEFYNLGYVVTILPFFFGGILCFATETRRALRSRLSDDPADVAQAVDLRNNLRLLAIFLVAVVGIFPITGMDAMGVWTSNLMISESYAIGLPVALLLCSTAIVFWLGTGKEAFESRMRPGDWIFAGVVLPLGIIGLGFLKISMMALGFLAMMYLALRLRVYRRPSLFLAVILLTVGVAAVAPYVSLPQHREGLAPLDFLKGFVPPAWWPFFVVVQLFWTLLYITLRLRAEGVVTIRDLSAALKARQLLDVELVTVVATAGIVPGFLLHIDGGSAFYFSDIQRWFSVGLIIAGAGTLVRGFKPRSQIARAAIAILALPLLFTTAANFTYWTKRMLAANAGTRLAAYPPEAAAGIPPGIRGLPRLTDPALLARGLEASKNYLPVMELEALASLPKEERSRTALFIPQSEPAYWTILRRPGACSFAAHVAPAIAGMVMVDGMPPFGCELSKYYGLALYTRRTREQIAADTLPSALCRRIARDGLSRVMTLHFDQTGRATRRVDECRSAE